MHAVEGAGVQAVGGAEVHAVGGAGVQAPGGAEWEGWVQAVGGTMEAEKDNFRAGDPQ